MSVADIETANALRRKTLRCAIYTRKSTEEGLEQTFNTLDAQRDSAEAFIRSQRQEGWVVLPDKRKASLFSPAGTGATDCGGSMPASASETSVGSCLRCCRTLTALAVLGSLSVRPKLIC